MNKEEYPQFTDAQLNEIKEALKDVKLDKKESKNLATFLLESLKKTELDEATKELILNSEDKEDKQIKNIIKENNAIIKYLEDYLKALEKEEKTASKLSTEEIKNVITKRPSAFLTPIDKVSNKAFDGLLNSNELVAVAMEKRGSKKEINTLVNINFNNMKSVTINGKKELTPYDREVYDSIITLFVDGKNEVITPQMIYMTMTGKKNINISSDQVKDINNSITKLMYSDVTIDATQEAEAYGFDSFKYSGNLLHAERITASINNNKVDAIHILKKPVLYDYAERKNQIGRVDIKLLNSPINKNKEVIALQGYLMRRILSMKSGKLSNTILYDTIYKQLEIKAATDGALRKKKSKVREQTKKILDYWKTENFIKYYTENKKGNTVYSISVSL